MISLRRHLSAVAAAYHSSRFSTVTGKGFRPRTVDLGRWRYLAASLFVLYFVVIVLLPFLVLVWSSLQSFYSAPSWAAFSAAFARHLPRRARLSAVLDDGAQQPVPLADLRHHDHHAVGAVISWVVVRTKIPGRWLLDSLASMPLVFPGLVLGLSIMICYLYIDIGIYGTIWIMLVAYVTRFLPYGMRYVSTSMMQIHKELEESAAMSGASWSMNFRRIVLPLLKPGPARGLHLCGDRLDPRAVELDPALQPRHRGGVDHDLGAVAERAVCRAVRARRDADPAAVLLVMIAQLIGKRFGIAER